MAAEIVNLNTFRKKKVQAEKQRQSAANRHKFGQTKSEKQSAKNELDRLENTLSGKEFDDEPEPA